MRGYSNRGLIWIAPALVFSGALIYYCIGYTGYISTLDWDGVSLFPTAVGLQNYEQLLQDAVFWQALAHTAIFFVVTLAAQITLGMYFAALLHSRIRLGFVYKILIFVPVVIAPATTAPVFRQIYGIDGAFNEVLRFFGLGGLSQAWLAEPATALAVVISIAVWQSVGIAFILYFAAMGQVDDEVIEAARMDGAGNLRVLRSIVWPGVRGTTVALSILSAISALKTFDIPNLVTGGGPNHATEFLGTLIYQVSLPQSEVGYGAAISVVLLLLAVGIAVLLSASGRERIRKEKRDV
jgi:ABC-type sugar transport system permease subunit